MRERLDGLLLLIARGATLEHAGKVVGCSGATLERWLPRICPDGYADALDARPHLRDNHGTSSRYQAGCRCVACSDANNLAMREVWARRKPPVHGTRSAYQNHGCTCDACRAAGTELNRERYRARRAQS